MVSEKIVLIHEKIIKKTKEITDQTNRVMIMLGASKLLMDTVQPEDEVLKQLVDYLFQLWQHSGSIGVKIAVNGKIFTSDGFKPTCWMRSADITSGRKKVGTIEIYFPAETVSHDNDPFLFALAEDLGDYLSRRRPGKKQQKNDTVTCHAYALTVNYRQSFDRNNRVV
ncbi:MAG: hypothetical protein ACFFD4_15345 [Candidatus Odinarchaeota archaeon]